MNNILTQNKLVKNLRAYPVLRKRWRGYIRGVRALPEGFTENKLFHDYLRVRRSNPEKRVSMSEYMIFGFYGLTTAQQKQYLTDVEATLLMHRRAVSQEQGDVSEELHAVCQPRLAVSAGVRPRGI